VFQFLAVLYTHFQQLSIISHIIGTQLSPFMYHWDRPLVMGLVSAFEMAYESLSDKTLSDTALSDAKREPKYPSGTRHNADPFRVALRSLSEQRSREEWSCVVRTF
jgi:hypothetical protein